LFLAHANSFHKETWEPTLSHLLSPTGGTDAYELIDEVWSWESVQHGDAALLNEGRLGCVFDWSDNARDIIHFLTHYLPSPLQPDAYYSATLPTHLPRLPAATARSRTTTGLGPEGRKLVAIGHSFGGCSLILAAAAHGALFERLVLIDAVVMMPRVYDVYPFVTGALKRRARWSGRDEARAQLVAKPFFAQWHPAALDVYVECGMAVDDQAESSGGGGGSIPSRGVSQPVRLKMSPLQEAVVFAEALATFEGWERIAEISPDVELRWVMPGETSMGGLQAVKERVWRRPANSSHVIIPTAGHLVCFLLRLRISFCVDLF
jgi:pimeloyl-ACP methyl ester carboxylesterase